MGMTSAQSAPLHQVARIGWQDIACPLCDARQELPILEVPWEPAEPPFRLVRCGRCGLGYQNPRPDEASIGRFYTDDYEDYHRAELKAQPSSGWRRYLERLVMADQFGVPPAPRGFGERWLAWLAAPWLGPGRDSLTALPYRGRGRLLEYGCGTGWFGHRMRQAGWDVTGMDFSPYAAEQAQRLFGLPVIVGSLPHPGIAPASYDVITMGQVLEHVHRPHDVIAAAARALRPGGYLAVAVPNLDSWGFRQFRESWWCLQLPLHLLHFTPPTLRRLLQVHGLQVRSVRLLHRPGWMRRSLAAAERRDQARRPHWLRALGRSRLAANLLTRWTVATGQGDCLFVMAYRPDPASTQRAA
jgi:SAM-dependent methyltransferase